MDSPQGRVRSTEEDLAQNEETLEGNGKIWSKSRRAWGFPGGPVAETPHF